MEPVQMAVVNVEMDTPVPLVKKHLILVGMSHVELMVHVQMGRVSVKMDILGMPVRQLLILVGM